MVLLLLLPCMQSLYIFEIAHNLLSIVLWIVPLLAFCIIISLIPTSNLRHLYHKSYKQALNSPVDHMVYYPLYPGLPSLDLSLPATKTGPKAGLPGVKVVKNDVLGLIMLAI